MGSPLGSLLGSPSTMDSPSGMPLYRAIEGKMVGPEAYLVERGKWKEKGELSVSFQSARGGLAIN